MEKEQIIDLLLNPNFKISNFELLVENIKDKDSWRILTKNTPNILLNDFSQHLKSTISKDRYNILSKQDKQLFLDFPILLLLLSESCYWLDNQYECYDKLLELNNLIFEDILLNELIIKMEQFLKYLEYEDDKLKYNIDEKNQCFILQNDITLDYDMEDINNKWNDFKKLSNSQQLALEQFSRYARISTNEHEGVFEADGKTWSRLIKKVFIKFLLMGGN